MPLVITDQYATKEMVMEKFNGFIYPNHPLKDYNPQTYQMLGRYYNPKNFYKDLFMLQRSNQLKPIEDFLVSSVEQFLKNENLLEEYSKNSISLYNEKFKESKLSNEIEAIFSEAVETKEQHL